MAKRKDERLIWTTDAETDPFKYGRVPKPFIWGLYTGTSFHHFPDIEPLVQFIRDQDVIVYAHNGGKFDFHFLLASINHAEPIKVINGRLVSAKIGKAEIRDSWNLLPVPLRELGGKLDMDFRDMEADRRDLPKVRADIITYLRGDCVSLWEAINKFESRYGRFLTQASACLAQWKQISGLEAPKTDRDFFGKFSQFYYGGRTQCFRKGHIRGPLSYIDINSAYGWAMLSEHPYWPSYIEIEYPKVIRPQSMVTLECVSLGALPWRNERGTITFPDDNHRRRYYVPGHEVIAALETGSIRDVQYISKIEFTGMVNFSDYVWKFFNQRVAARAVGDTAEVVYSKLLMLSLYGKWAANPDNYGNYMVVPFADKNDYKTDGFEFDGMLGPNALLRSNLDPWQENFFNVATAASITSQVRAKLWRAIMSSKNPAYCDTDSLMCETSNVDIGPELGQWKEEGTIDDLWIAGKKLYYAKGNFGKDKTGKLITEKKASKGVKASPAKIILAATGKSVRVYNSAPTFRLQRPPIFQKRTIKATA